MEFLLALLLAALWLPARHGRRIFRVLTALMFLACATILFADFLSHESQSASNGWKKHSSPFHSLHALVIIGLPCLWYTLTGRFSFRPEVSQEELAAEYAAKREAFNASLRQPDWHFYERHLQRDVPPALRALYADEKLITSTLLNYSDECSINTFEPLNESSLYEGVEDTAPPVVVIATTDFGDPIYLKPGPSESDAVYVTYHDGGDTEVLADSVAGFVDRLKQANKAMA